MGRILIMSLSTLWLAGCSLFGLLAEANWQPSGEATTVLYDLPWTLWFLRRNGAVIPVTR